MKALIKIIHVMLVWILCSAALAIEDLSKREYESFTLWIDCETRLAMLAFYEPKKDINNYQTSGYKLDDKYTNCRQLSKETYRRIQTPQQLAIELFDVGHIVPKNHMDISLKSIKESMYMGNMFPQESNFNQNGSWKYTEELTECLRDHVEVRVWAGVVLGNRKNNNWFEDSHGVVVPEYAWKAIYRGDIQKTQIYWMANNKSSTKDVMEDLVINKTLLRQKVDPKVFILAPELGELQNDADLWQYQKRMIDNKPYVQCLDGKLSEAS